MMTKRDFAQTILPTVVAIALAACLPDSKRELDGAAGAAVDAAVPVGQGGVAGGASIVGGGHAGRGGIAGNHAVLPLPETEDLAVDPTQLDKVCKRGARDQVTHALCATPRPRITGMVDLLKVLDLTVDRRYVALTSNSTSLVMRYVTPLNPRAIVISRQPDTENVYALGFVRGENFVEIAAWDNTARSLNFYLLAFEQACGKACSLADKLTEAVEKNWTAWTLYQDIDLQNRPLDCLVCHQPEGPGTPRVLLMQEMRSSWLHWMNSASQASVPNAPIVRDFRVSGRTISLELRTLTEQQVLPHFIAAHTDETQYAGVPLPEILEVDGPPTLEALLSRYWQDLLGSQTKTDTMGQELAIDSNLFEAEMDDPTHPTWSKSQKRVLAGELIAQPFYRADISDPIRRDAAAASFKQVVTKKIQPDALMDTRAVFSVEAERALLIRADPTWDAKQTLVAICSRCHNKKLDQKLSRAGFSTDNLDSLDAAGKQTIRERLRAPAPWTMPPPRFSVLDEATIVKIEAYLQR